MEIRVNEWLLREDTNSDFYNRKAKIANTIIKTIGVGIFSEDLFKTVYKKLFQMTNENDYKKNKERYEHIIKIFRTYNIFSEQFLALLKTELLTLISIKDDN